MSSGLSFSEIMKQRYSVRYFLPKPIPKETLQAIMETSILTPSWEILNHGIFMLLQETLLKI